MGDVVALKVSTPLVGWPRFYIGSADGPYQMPFVAMCFDVEGVKRALRDQGFEEKVDQDWIAEDLAEKGHVSFCDGRIDLVDFDGLRRHFADILSDVRHDFLNEKQGSPKRDSTEKRT